MLRWRRRSRYVRTESHTDCRSDAPTIRGRVEDQTEADAAQELALAVIIILVFDHRVRRQRHQSGDDVGRQLFFHRAGGAAVQAQQCSDER
jgi:hypothetical protein